MKSLAPRVIRLNKLIEEKTYKAIEVHPTLTRKALQMPLKYKKITKKSLIINLDLKGVIEKHPLATHEINAVAVVLTAVLHPQEKT